MATQFSSFRRGQDEQRRQEALDRIGLLRLETTTRLDAIVDMARRCFGTQWVSINLLDKDVQLAVSCYGAIDRETPRSTAFCDYSIREEGMTLVPDALLHPVLRDYPGVVAAPFVRFYAGYPIQSPDGYRIGSMCIFDPSPRDLDDLEQQALRGFALMAQDVLWASAAQIDEEGPAPVSTTASVPGHLAEVDPSSSGRVERGLTEALDHMRTGIYLFDREWRLFFVNQLGRSLFPEPTRVRLGDTLWAIDPATTENEFGEAIRAAADEGRVSSVRAYQPRLRGWFESTTYPIEDGVAIHFRDVTAEKFTREQLDDSILDLQRKAALLDATRDAIVVMDLDSTVSFWNAGARSLYGWDSSEAEGVPIAALVTSDVLEAQHAWDTVLVEGAWAGELKQVTRDGTTIVVDSRLQLLRNAEGEATFVLCLASDATDRRREQDARHRTQRMESLGTLAGGIAHDLNNVFTPILMSAQILASEETTASRAELLDGIEASVRRGADMIHQVLSFARGEDTPTGTVDVRRLIDELGVFCRGSLPKAIDVELDAPAELWPAAGDNTQVLQILMNLVTNARDAMPSGGMLRIRARNDGATTGSSGPSAKKVVIVEVEDTGEGMSESTLSRVFEPFFSTKPQGYGTGLGLSTSISIARSHGGDMRAHSEKGRGSTFVLELPAVPAEVRTETPTPPTRRSPDAPGNGSLVLVVDDEELIRSIVQRTLEQEGYATVTAFDGKSAIDVIERSRQPVDLVFTDMMMPVMGGAELIAWLGENRPDVPVVAASGLAANAALARQPHCLATEMLVKPFTGTEVVDAVHRALSGSGERS